MGCLQPVPLLQLGAARAGLHDRQESRPAQLLHPEDAAGHRASSDDPDAVEHNLMFSGHNAYRFASDPFYSNGFIPTVRQLVERILTGR